MTEPFFVDVEDVLHIHRREIEQVGGSRLKLTDLSWHAPGGGNRTAQVHYPRQP